MLRSYATLTIEQHATVQLFYNKVTENMVMVRNLTYRYSSLFPICFRNCIVSRVCVSLQTSSCTYDISVLFVIQNY